MRKLSLLADDDQREDGRNPGIEAATVAAEAVGGRVACPGLGRKADFWDVWHEQGPQAVQRARASATAPARAEPRPEPDNTPEGPRTVAKVATVAVADWPEPHPLTVKIAPEPYPLDALPPTIRAAVEEVAGFVKAPVPDGGIVGAGGAVAGDPGPCRCEARGKAHGPGKPVPADHSRFRRAKIYLRRIFHQAIRDYEEDASRVRQSPSLKDHKAAIEAWDAKRGGIKEKIRQLAKEESPPATKKRPCAIWSMKSRNRHAYRACSIPMQRRRRWPMGLAKELAVGRRGIRRGRDRVRRARHGQGFSHAQYGAAESCYGTAAV